MQIATWYTYRWLIERFHYVLKRGCKLEERRPGEAVRLERLPAVYCLVAWRVLWVSCHARQTPDTPSPHPFSTNVSVVAGSHAVDWSAFWDAKGDGEPGVKALWRGWTRLQAVADVFSALFYEKDVGNA